MRKITKQLPNKFLHGYILHFIDYLTNTYVYKNFYEYHSNLTNCNKSGMLDAQFAYIKISRQVIEVNFRETFAAPIAQAPNESQSCKSAHSGNL